MPPDDGAMGPMMVQSLISNIVISTFVAYVAFHALVPRTDYLSVFRVVGTVGCMSYAMGGVFGWLWI